MSSMGRGALSLVWGMALMGEPAALPESYWHVPAPVRDNATVVVSGRYWTGRGPSEPLPGGGHRWALLRGFEPTAVHRGEVKATYIGVSEPNLYGAETSDKGKPLVAGHEYLLLLRPSEPSLKFLRNPQSIRHHRDALAPDEVLAIVER
jgi:hypothetical protein